MAEQHATQLSKAVDSSARRLLEQQVLSRVEQQHARCQLLTALLDLLQSVSGTQAEVFDVRSLERAMTAGWRAGAGASLVSAPLHTGYSLLHVLVFVAPAVPAEPAHPLQLKLGAVLFRQFAFQVELVLRCLLNAVPEASLLLDQQDQAGRTPLHWAAYLGRPDMVLLLINCGARITIESAAHQTPFEVVQWDSAPNTAPPLSAPRVASPPMQVLPACAHASTHTIATSLGLAYGLRVYTNQFTHESSRAACKRLLFQAALQAAVDAGDAGDLRTVTSLVTHWQAAAEQHKLYPLCYRWFPSSPLYTAVASPELRQLAILKQLLRLPHVFYTQPGAPTLSALNDNTATSSALYFSVTFGPSILTAAALAHNPAAMKLLLHAGHSPLLSRCFCSAAAHRHSVDYSLHVCCVPLNCTCAGVNPNTMDCFDGHPVLADLERLEAGSTRTQCVRMLLDHGAKLAFTTHDGRTYSILDIKDALNGRGVSADILAYMQHKLQQHNTHA